MKSTRKIIILVRFAIFICIGLNAACSTTGSVVEGEIYQPPANGDSFEDVRQHHELISTDLVSVLLQLPEMAPFYTTIQTPQRPEELGKALIEALENSGYGIQFVTGDQGLNPLNYQISRVESETGGIIEFAINVGDVEIKRQYNVKGAAIYPEGPIKVKGVEAINVIVNSDMFLRQGDIPGFTSGVAFFDDNGDVLSIKASETISSLARTRNDDAFNQSRYLVLARAAIFTGDRIRSEKSELGKFNSDYSAIKKIHIRFTPASFNLGDHNKIGVQRLLQQYDSTNDLFHITGCVHGQTLMFDGTESKALTRQLRVKEELLTNGIPITNIREEGCFSDEFADEWEPYMVILTHRRANNTIN